MATIKPDPTLTAAVDLARSAAESIAEAGAVGDHLAVVMEGERVATHQFACLSAGYPDWRWSVTVTRVARSKHVTVSETHLLPSETSIVSPPWVPYAERIAPGDLGPGDINPYVEQDPNLEAGFEATGDEDVDQMAQWELGLGRKRVLSAEGREDAAQRWYDGDNGPTAEVAVKAPERCSSCGYFLPMAGALRRSFGVCANAWSPSDGRVVTLDHGCGAHSEVDLPAHDPRPLDPPVVDDLAVDLEVAHTSEVTVAEAPDDAPTAEVTVAEMTVAEAPEEAPTAEVTDEASTAQPEPEPVTEATPPAPRRGRRGSRRAGAPAGPATPRTDPATDAAAQRVAELVGDA
ncbi:DUF3027 domain-containing protein [Arsenicicoccus sp. MKL-02]|uniref:DUF3027 domain-containing protein n=3 Tax=Arsenicicoccus TaxID=267408 RepID=A0A6I3IE56_9MICO|nr:DUF3027 domain-containing protein [Arsenicicoccus cauae]MTB70943.1 DUF3027 domain-containing protein [Arsenicicoccus cauae]